MLFSTIDQKGYMHKIWRGIGGNSQFVSRVFFLYACFSCSLFIFFCMRYLKVVPIYWFGICLFLFDFVFVFFMQIEIVYNYGREDNDWNLILFFFAPLQWIKVCNQTVLYSQIDTDWVHPCLWCWKIWCPPNQMVPGFYCF